MTLGPVAVIIKISTYSPDWNATPSGRRRISGSKRPRSVIRPRMQHPKEVGPPPTIEAESSFASLLGRGCVRSASRTEDGISCGAASASEHSELERDHLKHTAFRDPSGVRDDAKSRAAKGKGHAFRRPIRRLPLKSWSERASRRTGNRTTANQEYVGLLYLFTVLVEVIDGNRATGTAVHSAANPRQEAPESNGREHNPHILRSFASVSQCDNPANAGADLPLPTTQPSNNQPLHILSSINYLSKEK
ncbi:hypothetical protein BDK51DRAFT_39803 [Blyttiomyces helicus]|uniref:Uncharacterized protein n=1 Tax=Blyttiomyces helicus TaxID=388810 RepID=A0A4P9WEM5_9FUNG|nr:hypothetical protein BDK51DRAFT_39803 [Blyttiomyces helicus]|eukprot:RKO91054.1 hypothetical protein BDK51DRAFT_39803 [Blyttiomyces helicus]